MPQPNQGKPAPSAHTSQPIEDRSTASPKGGEVHFGHTSGGTKGTK